jgi:aminoglycoside phosphotransferase (APT) family kinase protein
VLGPLIASGRTSDVHRFGSDGVAKVLTPATPQHWASIEASFTAAVRGLGLPAPAVRDVIDVDGRAAVVFELVDGPSMWQRMIDRPNDISALTRELAEIQRMIHEAGVPDGLPRLVDRMRLKFAASEELGLDEREAATLLLEAQPAGAALLHGDLHPGNILFGRGGPVVIDWFDATVGHPAADLARTMLLLNSNATDLRHLPGATPASAAVLARRFREEIAGRVPDDTLHAWVRLRAAGRLAERTDLDVSGLLEIWRDATQRSVIGDE